MSEYLPPTPAKQPPPPTAKPSPVAPEAAPEEIQRLIDALGNSADELHIQAENELITLGAQAVPALNTALNERGSWLRAYRVAEALGQIGDGRASRPLVEALRHPNSNVRWGVVRALAKVGDARALLPLRRVARNDRGRTSWGESVAAAAQVALNEMQDRSAALRLADPVKTAVLFAVAFVAVVLAVSSVRAFNEAMRNPSDVAVWGTEVVPIIPTEEPEEGEEGETDSATTATVTPTVAVTPTPTEIAITATVVRDGANIRPEPNTNNVPIAQARNGETIEIIERVGDWYRIRLPDNPAQNAWIAVSVVGPPNGSVPTR